MKLMRESPLYGLSIVSGGVEEQPYWTTVVLERIALEYNEYQKAIVEEEAAKRRREKAYEDSLKHLVEFTGSQAVIK